MVDGLHLTQTKVVPLCYAAELGPEFINKKSCSTELSVKFFLFIIVKMPTNTNVGILTFMSWKNSIIG